MSSHSILDLSNQTLLSCIHPSKVLSVYHPGYGPTVHAAGLPGHSVISGINHCIGQPACYTQGVILSMSSSVNPLQAYEHRKEPSDCTESVGRT